VQVNQPLLI